MVAPTNEQLASEVEGTTFATLFLDAVREVGPKVALGTIGESSVQYTYSQYADRVARIAAGLQARGLKRGERVVLMFRNIPEFHFIDTAITFCGATPISIYNSSSPEQIAYLAGHCEARLAIVEWGRTWRGMRPQE